MAWKYSTSYLPRDRSLGRESHQLKSDLYKSDANQNKWSSSISDNYKFHKNSLEDVKHTPIWSKSINDNNNNNNLILVQKLKERYNGCSEEPAKDTKLMKRTDIKDSCIPRSSRVYGRSLTTLDVGDKRFDRSLNDSTYKTKIEKENKGFENKFNFSENYMNDHKTTSKFLTKKYSDNIGQTSPSAFSKQKYPGNGDVAENKDDMITVVTRGTSPTPTVSTVYLRSKRCDYGIEKKVSKPSKKPKMVDKDMQTDREEISLSKYSVYSDTNSRPKLWTDNHSTYSPKFSAPFSCGGDTKREQLSPYGGQSPKEYGRSWSRSDTDEPTTPTSPGKSIGGKPSFIKGPSKSPLRDCTKKPFVRENSVTNYKVSNISNGDALKNSTSFYSSRKPADAGETFQSTNKITKNQSPKITIDHCPDIIQAIENASSASESSEEESSSDEEPENHSAPEKMSIKKSITNFLQNIPNGLSLDRSRPNLCQRMNSQSPQKIPQEKALWMENSEKEYYETSKALASSNLVPAHAGTKEGGAMLSPTKNFLAPPYALNRQFTVDKDWLKDEHENNEDAKVKANEDCNGFHSENDFVNSNSKADGYFLNTPKSVNIIPAENDCCHKMKIKQQGCEDMSTEDRNYLSSFPRQRSFHNSSQKLFNGVGNHVEEMNHVEGEMSGLVSKAKANLVKSKSKLDVKRSSSRETSPKIIDPKSEIDIYWQELADSLNRPLLLCDLDFTDLNSEDETDIFGNLKTTSEVPPPPPMLNFPLIAPPAAPKQASKIPTFHSSDNHPPCRNSKTPAPPPIPQIVKNKKTVRLFWKEVKEEPLMRSRVASNCNLIWDELAEVKVDTQKLEYLFESRAKDLISKRQQEQNKNKEIIVLESKRSNAINIGMTKLPPPRAIKTAILKMDSTVVSKEGIEKVLTMLPTEEERLRIQEAQNANPDTPLGSAEQFLLILSSITELEARLRLWAFKLDFENNEKEICEPLMDLKQGMEILRVNKTFRGILSTLLSIGNFLNGYDVKGFQIDYLSKVPEVKDTVHKHSLLHHLCIIMMDKFPESTDLYSEIGTVTRASKVDFDELSANLKKLEEDCKLSWNYLKKIAKHEGHTTMKVKMSDFLADCAERIIVLGRVHKRIMRRFQKFAYWLGVPTNRISTTRPNEVFKIISEFALEYRTTRDRVLQQIKKINREKSRLKDYHPGDYNDMVSKKMSSKEAKDAAKLKQLLENETLYSENSLTSNRRRQRKDTRNLLEEINKNDEEILEALVKTANQIPSTRPGIRERRRSRVYGKCCKLTDMFFLNKK